MERFTSRRRVESNKDLMSLDEEKGYRRQPLRLTGLGLAGLAFSTLGIIYSDIGTSPLYVLNGIWPASGDVPPKEDIVGGISAIVWSLTLLPFLKYVVFALEFGTPAGEGGPFALYMHLFPQRDPTENRSLTTYNTVSSGGLADSLYDSNPKGRGNSGARLSLLKRWRWPLFVWAVFGTSLTLSDGILTPAVSVTSAVGGIAVAKPSVSSDVVWVSILFLLFLFGIQPLGTQRIGFLLAPITAIWLLLLGGTGIYNITRFPGIWRAYDPSRAILWFVRTKNYDYLAGVLLCITGCEAMFANLGQFNAASIRIAFGGFVYPMLILAYLGQGASLIQDPTVISNIFYRTIPGPVGGGLYWVVFVFAVLATLIASQAMITGTFSLIHQLIGMRAFPQIRIKHTSLLTAGQVYIGAVNWLLMAGTIGVVGGFGSSSALTLAYGFAVATVLFVTTTFISLSIPFIKHLPYVLGLAFLLFFGFLDGLFWGASLKKVPHGAWFPLGLGGILCILICLWTWCRHLEEKYDDASSVRLADLLVRTFKGQDASSEADDGADGAGDRDGDGKRTGIALDRTDTLQLGRGRSRSPVSPTARLPILVSAQAEDANAPPHEAGHLKLDTLDKPVRYSAQDEGDEGVALRMGAEVPEIKLERIPVMAIFHRNDSTGRGVPHGFTAFLRRYPVLPRVVIFLSTRIVAQPHVPLSDRYVLSKTRSFLGFYTCLMRVGYLDRLAPSAQDLLPLLLSLETRAAPTDAAAQARTRELERVSRTETHVIPSYAIRSAGGGWAVWAWVRRVVVEELYARARVVFPDRTGLEDDEASTIHIAVPAAI